MFLSARKIEANVAAGHGVAGRRAAAMEPRRGSREVIAAAGPAPVPPAARWEAMGRMIDWLASKAA